MTRSGWLGALVVVLTASWLATVSPAFCQDEQADVALVASLGKIKDLNEKDPQIVRAEFTDPDGVVVEDEKLYVRWERTHKEQGRWIILSAFCPHSKCKVVFDAVARVFQDPCYGSEYDINGRVKQGPSKKPLPDYSDMAFEEDGLLKLRRLQAQD